MSIIDSPEKELNERLVWDLNSNLNGQYQELYGRLGLRALIAKAHADHPGYEVSELIVALFKKEGRPGLRRFYLLLHELEESASIALIDKSRAAELFYPEESAESDCEGEENNTNEDKTTTENKPTKTMLLKEKNSRGSDHKRKRTPNGDLAMPCAVATVTNISSTQIFSINASDISQSEPMPIANVTPYFFRRQQLSRLLWKSPRHVDLRNALLDKRTIVLQSSISEQLALEFCHETKDYNLIIHLDCTNDSTLLQDLTELAKWLLIPITELYWNIDTFFSSTVCKQLINRLAEDKALLIPLHCQGRYITNPCYKRLLSLSHDTCHILIPATEQLYDSPNIFTYTPSNELSWATTECQLFLSLMAFVEQRSILGQIIMHSNHITSASNEKTFEALTSVLQPLIDNQVIAFNQDDKIISTSVDYTSPHWSAKEELKIWIDVLQSTNLVPMSYEHFENKLKLFEKLYANNIWSESSEAMKLSFLNTFIEFFGCWQGEYDTDSRTLNDYHFQKYPAQFSLLSVLMDLHPPQTRYSHTSRENRTDVLNKARAVARQMAKMGHLVVNSVIAHYCAGHCLAEHKKWEDAERQLSTCKDLVEKHQDTLHEDHPIVVKVRILQAVIQCHLGKINAVQFQPCYAWVELSYSSMKNHSAITKFKYYLGIALIREEEWTDARVHLEESIKGQLQNHKLAPYTFSTVAGLLICYEKNPNIPNGTDEVLADFEDSESLHTFERYTEIFTNEILGRTFLVTELFDRVFNERFIKVESDNMGAKSCIVVHYHQNLAVHYQKPTAKE